ncbi:aldehyde dehydrogenase family protein [Aneurinibacillus terranovensis]|uniref:aldehyde dehydrogenase family protein n=1 Tax=Aneurinibacillus terranovensis TaxID=278991 RepID=UPI0004120607|nr:aldehyde dehydrogenase family protein [Aneurinibacillus terranovensis]
MTKNITLPLTIKTTLPLEISNFIDGEWVPSTSGKTFTRENPAKSSEIVAIAPYSNEEDTNRAVEAAYRAFHEWSNTPAPTRGDLLFRFASILEAKRVEVAHLLTVEQGKPLKESLGEVDKTIREVRYIAGEASRLGGETLPSERPGISIKTVRIPKGVIAAISPWNFPIVTPLRKIAPALAAGNTVVFKPASVTAAMGAKIIEIFEEAGLSKGVLNLVIGSGRQVGDILVGHPLVRGITFTGSTAVGSSIYRIAAERLVQVQLEMGGKNAAVIFDYEDIERAVDQIVPAAFAASGQRCTSISRIVVQRSCLKSLIKSLSTRVSSYKIGDGLDDAVTFGPLVSQEQLDTVERYVQLGLEEGASLIAGGQRAGEQGYFFQPTIFSDVTAEMRIAKEEIFGPVLTIVPVDDFGEALQIVNDTEYGLAASCFTKNMEYAERFASEVQTGMLHINNGTISESHVPFGGLKDSAVGPYSIGVTTKDFFTDLKVIYSGAK